MRLEIPCDTYPILPQREAATVKYRQTHAEVDMHTETWTENWHSDLVAHHMPLWGPSLQKLFPCSKAQMPVRASQHMSRLDFSVIQRLAKEMQSQSNSIVPSYWAVPSLFITQTLFCACKDLGISMPFHTKRAKLFPQTPGMTPANLNCIQLCCACFGYATSFKAAFRRFMV